MNEEIIIKDPTCKIKNPKKEKRMPKAMTIEELEMVRESCKTLRERAMVEVFYATGCRLSEINNIDRFKDINWRNMSIVVVGKGNKQRVVYFGYKVIFHLKKYLNSRTDDGSALFITQRKPYRKLSNRGIQREIKIIAKRCGLEDKVHVHTYRHTLATNLLNNGSDLSTVSEILGHAEIGTTQIYAQVTNEHINQTYKKCFVQ
jgi:integrase/recombinase XerD